MGTRRAAAKIEGAALALAALAPLAPHALYLARRDVPRFSMYGDYAVLEQVTRFVTAGRTLVGPYSRFGFSHPGPLLFYVMAPIYWLCGGESRALFVAALAINAAAVVATVLALRVCASRAHALAGALVLIAWTAAFGDVVCNVWNPLVIALPLVAFLTFAALLAAGDPRAIVPGAVFGAFVAQTHVGAVLVVAAAGAGAAFAHRRRARLGDRARRRYLAAAAWLALSSVPIVVDQIVAREGNLVRLAKFFFDPALTRQSFGTAVRAWALATSWLPDRALRAALPVEEGVPLPMSWQPIAASLPSGAAAWTVARLGLAAAALALAWRRRDRSSAALLGAGLASEALAAVVLRGIVGDVVPYLLFWVTAASAVTWLGVAAAACRALATLRGARALGAIACVAAAAWAAHLQGPWIERNRGFLPVEDATLRDAYARLVLRLDHDGADAVLQLEGAWTKATVLALELSKDGRAFYVPRRKEHTFGMPPRVERAKNPLHVYAKDPWHELPQAPCLELLYASEGTTLYVSRDDVLRCP